MAEVMAFWEEMGSPVSAEERRLSWERDNSLVAPRQQIGTYPDLSSPRAATLLQHHLQNPRSNCHIRVPFSTDKIPEIFSEAWLLTPSTDIKHWYPRSLTCYKFCPWREMKSLISKLPSGGCHICRSPLVGAICLHLHHWNLTDLLKGRIMPTSHCCMLTQMLLIEIIFW